MDTGTVFFFSWLMLAHNQVVEGDLSLTIAGQGVAHET